MKKITIILLVILVIAVTACSGCVEHYDGTWDNVGGAADYHTDKYHSTPQNERDGWSNNGNSLGRDQ